MIDTYPHYKKNYEIDFPMVHKPGYTRKEKHIEKPEDLTVVGS